ncbi:MAG TPA: type III-B CRISPR module RAMP protein Cmr1 [Smithellaceae bacterium]|nr:type III-B CRISPR module RAMP protein Cmr1 [Smithellaceae bacterium]HQM44462.1 type III-B CRISPR module RAMP protein Cmr1 [Smithellaceae bacterium]
MFNIARFKDIEKREYECEVVTPLFLGGADPKKAELRVPPIKAAMRFWWRALYGGDDIQDMADRESTIFGSTEKKSKVKVSIEINGNAPVFKDLPTGTRVMVTSKQKTFPISIIEYLAFGLFDPKQRQGKYLRQHMETGTHFKIGIACTKYLCDELDNTLKTMLCFGGLGSRSRNGFGSIQYADGCVAAITNAGNLKSFPAFSKETKLFNKFKKCNHWEEALSDIGLAYRNARLALEDRHKFIKRGLIAMPIESKFERNIPKEIREGRHAKPYFLHVNKTSDGKYQGQILFLPYQYKSKADDRSNQVNEYMTVCKRMNDEILKAIGGAK